MLCRLPSWKNSCLIFPASFHRDTATTMEGIVTMYQDFMKKAGEWLCPAIRQIALQALLPEALEGGLSSLKHPWV